MAVIVNKESNKNTELSRRIDADLRSKVQSQERSGGIDDIEDTEYTKDLKKTGRFGWVWIVLVVMAVLSLLSMFFL